MKLKKTSRKAAYHSTLRKEQARLTLTKIQDAVLELFQSCGSAESLTYKAIAQKAGVTEMTVYRHFPQRSELMKTLWERINQNLGQGVGMPWSVNQLLGQNSALHEGFSKNAVLASASVMSQQGREMRSSLDNERQAAFLGIVKELNPGLKGKTARQKAAILQLLHSAYAWDSLQLHWGFSGEEISESTRDALEVFIQHIKKARNA